MQDNINTQQSNPSVVPPVLPPLKHALNEVPQSVNSDPNKVEKLSPISVQNKNLIDEYLNNNFEKGKSFYSTSRKVSDFCLGFFGVGVLWALGTWLLFRLDSVLFTNSHDLYRFYSSIELLLHLMLFVGIILFDIWAFMKKRLFLGFGILFLLTVSLILIGVLLILVIKAIGENAVFL